jgi:hypothetical protein
MHLGVIDAEGLYLDDDMSGPRLRLGDLFDDRAIGTIKFFENDCAHRATPRKALQFRLNVERHLERDRKLPIAAAISSQCVSRAKWPASKKRTSASAYRSLRPTRSRGAITAAHQG